MARGIFLWHPGRPDGAAEMPLDPRIASPGVGGTTLAVGNKRHRRRTGRSGGGALTSLRGGFRSVARSVTKNAPARPASRTRRVLGNVVTVVLLLIAVGLLLRRFGLLHR